MAVHNELGKEAEQMAVSYLIENGYEILYCNWRYSHYEIDIIARKSDFLKIVEVKSLKGSNIKYPEESVTKKKFKNLKRASEEFLFQNPQYQHVQFDILSIIRNGEASEFFLIEDVFL